MTVKDGTHGSSKRLTEYRCQSDFGEHCVEAAVTQGVAERLQPARGHRHDARPSAHEEPGSRVVAETRVGDDSDAWLVEGFDWHVEEIGPERRNPGRGRRHTVSQVERV